MPELPEVLSPPRIENVALGGKVSLPCVVVHANDISWLNGTVSLAIVTRDKETIRLTYKDDDRIAINITTFTLDIKGVRASDAGQYTCKVSDSQRVTHEIVVLEPPRLVSAEPAESPVNVALGKHVNLQCHFEGNPKPSEVYWTRTGASGDEKTVETKGHLHLSNVDMSTTGNYTCHSSNEAGQGSHTFSVVLNELPRLVSAEPAESPVIVDVGKHVDLKCHFEGNPKPSEVYWTRTGASGDEKTVETKGHLHLSNVDMSTTGNYTCHSSNEAGQDSHTFSVVLNQSGGPNRIVSVLTWTLVPLLLVLLVLLGLFVWANRRKILAWLDRAWAAVLK